MSKVCQFLPPVFGVFLGQESSSIFGTHFGPFFDPHFMVFFRHIDPSHRPKTCIHHYTTSLLLIVTPFSGAFIQSIRVLRPHSSYKPLIPNHAGGVN